jgi:hypothetical protein
MLGGIVLAVVILANGGPFVVVAADKADKVKDRKADSKGVVEITKGKDDKFRFFVRDGEGKLLAMSGPSGFESPKDAEAAVDHLREVLAKAKVHVKDKDDKKDDK